MYLELKDISVKYGKLIALNKISLEIERGDILGLIGPNGSGKTTLLKVIIGLIKPKGGEIIIDGKRIKPTRKEIRKIIGYSPQETVSLTNSL